MTVLDMKLTTLLESHASLQQCVCLVCLLRPALMIWTMTTLLMQMVFTWEGGASWERSRQSSSQSSQQRARAQQASSQQLHSGNKRCKWPAKDAYNATSDAPPACPPSFECVSATFSAACFPQTAIDVCPNALQPNDCISWASLLWRDVGMEIMGGRSLRA